MAVMMPLGQYDEIVGAARLKMVIFLLGIAAAAIAACVWMSKRYVTPILEGLEQVKSDRRDGACSSIPEINDLFVFLEEKDREQEEALQALTQEKEDARSETDRLQQAYRRVQREYETAKLEISRLAYARKQEIDPDDYERFLAGIGTLTPAERKIFDYYLSGKSGKEIQAAAAIKESTLRYHNQNIYSKLGVNSLKQLLRYAALMRQQEEEEKEREKEKGARC